MRTFFVSKLNIRRMPTVSKPDRTSQNQATTRVPNAGRRCAGFFLQSWFRF
jgi:hypothetical protein